MFDFNKLARRLQGDADDMEEIGNSEVIQFATEERFYDVIPEPIPANNVLPEWYKDLPGKLAEGLRTSSVKRCMPFLDAMTMGWIIPLCAETEVEYKSEDMEVDISWEFERQTASGHAPAQIGGSNHPLGDKAVLKWHNYWAIKVPDGYSVLFTSPLNRIEQRFQVFSGVVDCDNYYNYVNFPFVWTGGDFHGIIEKGTPLIQAIPFKRDGILGEGEIKAMSKKEEKEMRKEQRRMGTEGSLYRNERWKPKNASRVANRESDKPSDPSEK